ncbi:MAG: hypothetical protein JJU02_16105 [Cryomorphaceae bacterium]|nr:hypothetical protein [Cryomorphaceae bacterium]
MKDYINRPLYIEKIKPFIGKSLINEDTINREFGNLLEIRDNYPKYVVTMDDITEISTFKGIIHMHIKDFCLKMVSK